MVVIRTINSINVLLKYRAIPLALHVCQSDVDIDFFLYNEEKDEIR